MDKLGGRRMEAAQRCAPVVSLLLLEPGSGGAVMEVGASSLPRPWSDQLQTGLLQHHASSCIAGHDLFGAAARTRPEPCHAVRGGRGRALRVRVGCG